MNPAGSPPTTRSPLRVLCDDAQVSLLRLSEASGVPYQSVVGMAAGRRPIDARIYTALRRAGHDVEVLKAQVKVWERARKAQAQAELAQAVSPRI